MRESAIDDKLKPGLGRELVQALAAKGLDSVCDFQNGVASEC